MKQKDDPAKVTCHVLTHTFHLEQSVVMGRYRENEKDFSFLVYSLRRMVHLAVTGMKFLKYFVFCGMQESYAAVKALAHLGCRLISNSEIQGLS